VNNKGSIHLILKEYFIVVITHWQLTIVMCADKQNIILNTQQQDALLVLVVLVSGVIVVLVNNE